MNTLRLQQILAAAGFNPGLLDGQMGKQTRNALMAWQASKGLLADGVVGPKTLIALGVDLPPVIGPTANVSLTRPLTVSPSCIDCIKAWEGLEDGDKRTVNLEPYADPVGIWTLGWGHALTDERGAFVRSKTGADAWMLRMFGKLAITRDEAKSLLAMDVNAFLAGLEPVLAGMPTTQSQLDAITSFAFNAGVKGFSSSTLLSRHRAKVPVSARFDYGKLKTQSQAGNAAGPTEFAFAAWSKAGGKWMLGIFRRRVCEALLYGGGDVAKAIITAQGLR